MDPNQSNPPSGESSPNQIPQTSNSTAMGVLSYLGPLVIVPYLTAKNDSFVKFHIKQGVFLLIVEVAVWIIAPIFWVLWPLLQLVNLVTLILAIIGIVNVVRHKEQLLPLVGKYAASINI